MTFRLVDVGYSLAKGQVVKLIFFALWSHLLCISLHEGRVSDNLNLTLGFSPEALASSLIKNRLQAGYVWL